MSAQKHTILGIETSCDETAVALLEVARDVAGEHIATRITKHLIASQVPIHQKYGGVVPEVAARSHVVDLVSLLDQIDVAQVPPVCDAIAVTSGPGLSIALRVGVEAARALSWSLQLPLMGVNHLEGHIASAWLNEENRRNWNYPLLALVVSGGHTELVLIRDLCHYRIIGRTRDDAAGEAFDKTAKLMGLSYPGGPQIARLAEHGTADAVELPRPMLRDGSFDFSFSGLKTAVRLAWEKPIHPSQEDMAASVQQAIVDVLTEKTMKAAKHYRVRGVLLVGGVSANEQLRATMQQKITEQLPGVAFLPSDRAYITDNAAMIAAAGYWRWQRGDARNWKRLEVKPEWDLA